MSVFSENVRQDIEKYGVSIIYVGDENPPFAYTVGLWLKHQHPELIIFGLSDRVMWSLLNEIAELVGEGQRFTSRAFLPGIGGKFGVTIEPAQKKFLDAYFGFALGFYEEQFPIAQVIWPDKKGHFPGDAGYNTAYEKLQPVLV
ncbi:MAG: DUF4262 domain-containing protein [Azonexus sp.]|jgi:hypothetical protein|nr:DUF4262 domain-containing protein [Azonexus sp.]